LLRISPNGFLALLLLELHLLRTPGDRACRADMLDVLIN
jgi:hypothetical protein